MPLMILAALLAAAAGPVALEPTGKWTLDAGAQSCLLMRTFGNAPSAVTLVLHPRPGMPQIDVLNLYAADGIKPKAKQSATVTLLPSRDHFHSTAETEMLAAGRARDTISVPVKMLDMLPTATHFTLAILGRPPEQFHLGNSANAISALKVCEDDLLRSWGVDPARFRPLIAPGDPGYVNLAKYLGNDDYPAAALRVSGKAMALTTVDETGKVSTCRIVESAGNTALDAKTCEVASRVRYPPAHDASGAPVSSWTIFPIVWIPAG